MCTFPIRRQVTVILLDCQRESHQPSSAVCCRRVHLLWPLLAFARHCHIENDGCPTGYTTYPIWRDRSCRRKLDSGTSCCCATTQQIDECFSRYPYSPGSSTWGSNCQTSVSRAIGNCCMRSNWRPSPYAHDDSVWRGECLQWREIRIVIGAGNVIVHRVCVRWELPDWRRRNTAGRI